MAGDSVSATPRSTKPLELVNWPTLVTSLLLAVIVGAFATWSGQQRLSDDLGRLEEKIDDVVEIVELAHPRRVAP